MNTTAPNSCLASEPDKAGHETKVIRSQDWFGRSSVVFIEHRGERYELRQTRNGKLILTK